MFPTVKLDLMETDFEPVDSSLTWFHGPTIEILGCLFHCTAVSVKRAQPDEGDEDSFIQEGETAANEQFLEAMQGVYEGAYTTIQLRGKPCVLVIHPFSD
jgi:hypothetical protein